VSLIDRRVGLLFAIFVFLLVAAIGRAAWIQGVQGDSLSADAQLQQTEDVTIPGQRGRILDRHGKELAVSEDAADVIATPYQVKDPTRTAKRLAPILGVPEHQVLSALADRSSGFAYLARQVDLNTAAKVRKLGIAGISTTPDSRRVYPEGDLATQVIGTVGVDDQGLTGLEAAQNSLLAGQNGERKIVLDGLGKEIERETVTPPDHGEDLKLTLDAGLQSETQRVLDGVAATYKPQRATAIVMDPRNSQILAMADWPPVNPNDLTSASPEDLQNMATSFTYEPGSTYKAITVAGALQDHVVTPDTTFDLPTTLQVADRTIQDAEDRGPETLTVAQILAQSSNVGAVEIGLRLNQEKGPDRFNHWVRTFGFGRPTGIDFPGEEQGIVPRPSQYSGSTMGNLPIGQGLSVTPIQMATFYAAIANGGILRTPQLVLDENGQPVREPRGTRVMSRDTAAKLSKMLEGVLAPGGTASEVSVPGYTLAGKTGTAQKVVNGTYSHTQFVASFVGFAPASNPRLLVAVVVDQPSIGSYYGGVVAAPAFGEIAKFALPYLGIPPDTAP
jgi:cell division protein FtsI/penicillin-binding protein 2